MATEYPTPGSKPYGEIASGNTAAKEESATARGTDTMLERPGRLYSNSARVKTICTNVHVWRESGVGSEVGLASIFVFLCRGGHETQQGSAVVSHSKDQSE